MIARPVVADAVKHSGHAVRVWLFIAQDQLRVRPHQGGGRGALLSDLDTLARPRFGHGPDPAARYGYP
jgi:hypothetical protein